MTTKLDLLTENLFSNLKAFFRDLNQKVLQKSIRKNGTWKLGAFRNSKFQIFRCTPFFVGEIFAFCEKTFMLLIKIFIYRSKNLSFFESIFFFKFQNCVGINSTAGGWGSCKSWDKIINNLVPSQLVVPAWTGFVIKKALALTGRYLILGFSNEIVPTRTVPSRAVSVKILSEAQIKIRLSRSENYFNGKFLYRWTEIIILNILNEFKKYFFCLKFNDSNFWIFW